jgi:hypothetical protein
MRVAPAAAFTDVMDGVIDVGPSRREKSKTGHFANF